MTSEKQPNARSSDFRLCYRYLTSKTIPGLAPIDNYRARTRADGKITVDLLATCGLKLPWLEEAPRSSGYSEACDERSEWREKVCGEHIFGS